jgi:hypothetical protein
MSWRDDPYRSRTRDDPDWRDDLHRGTGRARRWLASRPTESWLFFAAGFILATILT